MKTKNLIITIMLLLVPFTFTLSQRKYNPPPMNFDVGAFNMVMNKLNGDGGLQSQYSWNLAGANRGNSTLFYWPQDEYHSNMLYQIFNPVSLDDKGIKDENGVVRPMYSRSDVLTNPGTTDWASETRRYRPPHVTVDGVAQDAPYLWNVDPKLKSDIKIEFEDVCGQFGIRSHVEMLGFSNADHQNYFIWKATHKFTGEVKIPKNAMNSKDTLPDQTIRFWWPISYSFGPSKNGERIVMGGYSYEGEDDLDSWYKAKSSYNQANRDSLYIAYYYDSHNPSVAAFNNGSSDDTGDPDRVNGHLYSAQIPGFTLLYADKAFDQKVDDKSQPYAMPHAGIAVDLWGSRELTLKLKYRGDDGNGRFPLNPAMEKGPMRFITVGPYELTKDSKAGRYDSVTIVYAVGSGSIGWQMADSVGKMWMRKEITDQQKNDWIMKGRDSLTQNLDKANWAWSRLSKGMSVPAAPPSPDLNVTAGPDQILLKWNYPDQSFFSDAVTGVDDWYAWKVYRKAGGYYVNDPNDQKNGSRWELIYQTTNRAQTTFVDTAVIRGVDYYYAVTAVDNGSQNPDDIIPNQRLESSRFINRSFVPTTPFKPGLNEAGKVRVVPNPATSAAGALASGSNKDRISFYNLPIKCTLRIYTESGDLAKSIEHYGTADEHWNQRTDDNQFVASGIYIAAITDAQDINGQLLDNQFVKFIIVR